MFDGGVAITCERDLLRRLVAVFNREFWSTCNTELIPGADEPVYLPADRPGQLHRLYSREDYPASVLHEAAHWCLAGEKRRQQVDFGYWYAADGRNARQQAEFQQVEVKPQAIEWAFSRAAGMPFRVSIDNLSGEAVDPFGFELAVWQQACDYQSRGLPVRAAQFVEALHREFGTCQTSPELGSLRGWFA